LEVEAHNAMEEQVLQLEQLKCQLSEPTYLFIK